MIKYIDIIIENFKKSHLFFKKLLKGPISFIELEEKIRNFVNENIVKPLFVAIFQQLFFLLKDSCKKEAKKKGYSLLRTNQKTIRIYTGEKIKISTWYATNNGIKGMKKGTKNVFLEQLGFVNSYSPLLTSEVVSSGLYCPSYQIASEVLSNKGIKIDDNKIVSLTYKFAEKGIENRGKISFNKGENFEGKDIFIMIDGGRICTRENKKGRPKKGLKGKGFKGVWKEPKCFVIGELEDGKLSKNKPFYDGEICSAKEMYEILKLYLVHGKIEGAKSVTIAGDGAKWIWENTKKLLLELGVEETKITEVLDYFHGVEHLSIFLDNLSLNKKTKKQLFNKLKKLLWNGKTTELLETMEKQKEVKNEKLHQREINYFTKHQNRILYSTYRKEKKPCGSGTMESMIRRVINLRLKGPSIFWKKENANKALFIRAQLLSGRWNTFVHNMLSIKLFS